METAAADLRSGDIVVIADKAQGYALDNAAATNACPAALPLTVLSNGTAEADESMTFVVTVTDEGRLSFESTIGSGYSLTATGGKSNNTGIRVNSAPASLFDWDADYAKLRFDDATGASGHRWLGVYVKTPDWRSYNTGDGTNIKNTVTAFYKQVDSQGPTVDDNLLAFDNTLMIGGAWEHVFAYVWDADETKNAEWPGQEMTDDDGDGIFTLDISDLGFTPTGMIFNNGAGVQTPDLAYVPGKVYSCEWIEFSFDNGFTAWDDVYAHIYNGAGGSTEWPGVKMTDEDADGVFTLGGHISFLPNTVIFNNGDDAQLDELAIENGKLYGKAAGAAPEAVNLDKAAGEYPTGTTVSISAPGADYLVIDITPAIDAETPAGEPVIVAGAKYSFTLDLAVADTYTISSLKAVKVPFGWTFDEALASDACVNQLVDADPWVYTVVERPVADSNNFRAAEYTFTRAEAELYTDAVELINIDGSTSHSGLTSLETSLIGKVFEGTNVTLEFFAEGNNYPTCFGNNVRLYGGDSIVITPKEGSYIYSVTLITAASSEGTATLYVGDEPAVVDVDTRGAGKEVAWAVDGDLGITDTVSIVTSGKLRLKYIIVSASASATGIEAVAAVAAAPAEYYNLQGVRVAQTTQGLYIVRQGGRTSKIFVK